MTKSVMPNGGLVLPMAALNRQRRVVGRVSIGACVCSLTIVATARSVGSQAIGPVLTMLPSATMAQSIPQGDATALERAAHAQINRHRASQNLSPLQWQAKIAEQARKHSQAMAQGHIPFSHSGFSQRVKAVRIPYRGAAENVGYNQGYQQPVAVVVQGWLNSAGHRKNIEGSYDLTGVGVASNAQGAIYFTQIFLRSR